jgi:WD40 repeat protein
MLKQLDGIVALAFSSQGDKLAVATKLGTIQLADANDWNKRTTLCADATDVACLAFSPSGSTLLANQRGQLLGWDLQSPDGTSHKRVMGQENASQVCSAVFAHDGDRLAIGRMDGSVELWDTRLLSPPRLEIEDGRHQLTLKGHLDRVASMSFSSDGRTLATGSWDTTVRLWHVASGREVAAFNAHHGKVEAVAFSPDGAVLATGGQRDADHGEVFLWRATQ